MKKTLAMLMAILTLSVSALAEAPTIEKIEYEGNGIIEVDFHRDVTYENLTVEMKDLDGNAYPVTIFVQDDDDLTFRAEDLKGNTTYEITISGIRSGMSGDFETVTGQLELPETSVPAIKSVEYDGEDRELDIDFVEAVDYDSANLLVEVSDSTGTTYTTRIIETDSDSLELQVDGLTYGEMYLVKVSGVSLRGQSSFVSASMEFTAVDR